MVTRLERTPSPEPTGRKVMKTSQYGEVDPSEITRAVKELLERYPHIRT